MALDLRMENGFQAISFEYSDILDPYFIHRYIIIKYISSSITDKLHQLLSELWPLILVRKMVSGRYLLNTLVHWIYISHIKYRSSSNIDKTHQLLSELWPLISV